MMIGVQILLRTLVYQVVLRPKPKKDNKLGLNENSKANLLLFASVLYHIIADIWKKIPSDPANQNHLRKLDKVRSSSPLFIGMWPCIFKQILIETPKRILNRRKLLFLIKK